MFRAMFSLDMKEKEATEIDVVDVTPETLAQMLEFMYTGSVAELDDRADELLGEWRKWLFLVLLTMMMMSLLLSSITTWLSMMSLLLSLNLLSDVDVVVEVTIFCLHHRVMPSFHSGGRQIRFNAITKHV